LAFTTSESSFPMDFWIIDIKGPPYQGIIFPHEIDIILLEKTKNYLFSDRMLPYLIIAPSKCKA
jgi:hypothetical protein